MSEPNNLPHGGKTWEPWPHEPPEGWPYEYVASVDFAALAARLAEVEERIENARQFCLKRADHKYILGALHGIIEPEARAAASASTEYDSWAKRERQEGEVASRIGVSAGEKP